MNLSSLPFSLVALFLLFLALIVLCLVNGAPENIYFAFAPALVWAAVLAWRWRNLK